MLPDEIYLINLDKLSIEDLQELKLEIEDIILSKIKLHK